MGNHNGDSDDEEDDAKNIVMLYPNLQTIYKHKERRLSVAQRYAILLKRKQVILQRVDDLKSFTSSFADALNNALSNS